MDKTSICNLALRRLAAKEITDLSTQNSVEAKECRNWYEPTLKELLRMSPWSFAIKRASLNRSTTDPSFGWKYQYALPEDYVQLLECNAEDVTAAESDLFEVENNHVLSDEAAAKIRYVYFNDNPATYSPDFIDIFSTLLAFKMAVPLGVGNLAPNLYELFQREHGKAAMRNNDEHLEKLPYPWHLSPLVKARNGSSAYGTYS